MDEKDQVLEVEKTIQALTEKGYSVRKKEDEVALIDREIRNSHSKLFSLFDTELETLTGLKKEGSEKSTEFLKRAFNEKFKVVNELSGKVKEFETKGIETSEIAKEYKKRAEILEQEKKEIESKLSGELNSLKSQVFQAKIDSVIGTAIANLKPTLRADISGQILDDIIYAKISKFNQEYKPKEFEGVVVFTDKDGEVIRSKKDGKPMTANEIIEGMFSEYIDKGRKLGGSGSGTGDASSAKNWESIAKEKGFTTLEQVTSYLNQHFAKEGKTNLSKEYNDAFKAIRATLTKIR